MSPHAFFCSRATVWRDYTAGASGTAAEDDSMSPAEARRRRRDDLSVPRPPSPGSAAICAVNRATPWRATEEAERFRLVLPGNAGLRTLITREIAPRRGALQKRHRQCSRGSAAGTAAEDDSMSPAEAPEGCFACPPGSSLDVTPIHADNPIQIPASRA